MRDFFHTLLSQLPWPAHCLLLMWSMTPRASARLTPAAGLVAAEDVRSGDLLHEGVVTSPRKPAPALRVAAGIRATSHFKPTAVG